MRIYVVGLTAVWIQFLIKLFMSEKIVLLDFVKYTIFPYSTAWFLKAILVLYILYYWVAKLTLEKKIKSYVVIFLCAVVYLVSYPHFAAPDAITIESDTVFKWIFYFVIMYLGFLFKTHIGQISNRGFKWDAVLTLVCVIGFYFVNLVLCRRFNLYGLQFLVHVFLLGFTIFISRFLYFSEDMLCRLPQNAKSVIIFISDRTLEIYMIQYFVISKSSYLDFPVSFVCAILGILIMAQVTHVLSRLLFKPVEGIIARSKSS